MTATMDAEALNEFLKTDFPQVADDFRVEHAAPMAADVRLRAHEKHLRPGGTVSGPAMFALADLAMYAAILASVGPKALTVTTSCSIDFMRKPEAGRDMIAQARLLKLGRVLVVGDAFLYSEGAPEPVARASLTYSIPPR